MSGNTALRRGRRGTFHVTLQNTQHSKLINCVLTRGYTERFSRVFFHRRGSFHVFHVLGEFRQVGGLA